MIDRVPSPKVVCAVVCACIVASSIVFPVGIPAAQAADVPFPDTAGTWFRYRESISYLVKRKAISGYPDGTFQPKKTVSRAEFIKLLFAARSDQAPAGKADCFSDVDPEAWYSSYVCAAARRKIVNGYPDGTFKPEQTLNFAEAIKMITLAYGKEITETPGEHWYESYAAEVAKNSVFPRNTYLPWKDLSRERAADLIARLIRYDEDRRLPNLSNGCGKARTNSLLKVNVNGVDREFLLDVPEDYVPHDPYPLIVAFHGRTNPNEQVRSYYGLTRSADEYFVAYPAAIKNANGTFSWSDGGDKSNALRDYAFFDAVVESIAEQYCIDMDKIYTVGHSLGAWMANSVACARGGIVRASATVGGDSVIIPCAGPSASLQIHHQRDNLTSFASAQRAYELRVKENSCSPATEPVEPRELQCIKHVSCDGGNTVVWCPHEIDQDEHLGFYPHQWPKGTAQAIVKFFEGL